MPQRLETAAERLARARLRVADPGERFILQLSDGSGDRGMGVVRWDGRDEWGRQVPRNVCFILGESPFERGAPAIILW